MKTEHYEDFALITQYFNIRDLSAQKFVQTCKRIGDDFLEVSLSEVSVSLIVNLSFSTLWLIADEGQRNYSTFLYNCRWKPCYAQA